MPKCSGCGHTFVAGECQLDSQLFNIKATLCCNCAVYEETAMRVAGTNNLLWLAQLYAIRDYQTSAKRGH